MDWLCILKVVGAWVAIMLIGTNLVGFVARGLLWAPPPIESEFLRAEVKQMGGANTAMTILGIVLSVAYLFALFHFWNFLLALVGAALMASRVPDLLWELRTGSKVTKSSGPKGLIPGICTSVIWFALPAIWYALCQLN